MDGDSWDSAEQHTQDTQGEKRTIPEGEFTFDSTRRPSEVLIEALVAVSGTDPFELEPLYDSVDPDALDALFAQRSDGTKREGTDVSFETNGYRVEVTGDGRIVVEPDDEP